MEDLLLIVVLVTAAPFLLFSMVLRGGMNFGHLPVSMRFTVALVVTIMIALSLGAAYVCWRKPLVSWAIPFGVAVACMNVLVLLWALRSELARRRERRQANGK